MAEAFSGAGLKRREGHAGRLQDRMSAESQWPLHDNVYYSFVGEGASYG